MPPESSNSSRIEQILTDIALAIRGQNTRTVDANGWTVFQYGSHTRYTRKVSFALSSFNGPAFVAELGVSLPVGLTFDSLTSFNATFVYNGSGSVRFTQEAQGSATSTAVVGTTTSASNSSGVAYYECIV